ncbi:MAG: hypothetical protein IJS96_07000 [Schwartzia sp.]|nr:hypothetical protein [Schwartzia sp. (in: firmicutes)]
MRVLVKRFCLSYGRRIYKAGEVVDIADEKTAKELIARSGGDLEAVHATDAVPATSKTPLAPEAGGAGELPDVDPLDAVQPEKPKGKKK